MLGDGYFEIAKHVWLAAYFLAVTATSVLIGPPCPRRAARVFDARKRRARQRRPPLPSVTRKPPQR